MHQRTIASKQHAGKEAAHTSNRPSRPQRKDDLPRPSAGARFFAEKVRAGKCVFASTGLLIFGQLSGPGMPGPFRAPGRAAAGRGRGEAWTPGRLKRAPLNAGGVRPDVLAQFPKTFTNHCVFKENTRGPGNPRPASGNRIYSPTWPITCLLYTSPSPRDRTRSRMPSSA